MKFRIMEQRGKYRIEVTLPFDGESVQVSQDVTETRTLFSKNTVIEKHFTRSEGKRMVAISEGKTRLISTEPFWRTYLDTTYVQLAPADFDSYEEAENFIWEEWGNEGWRNIEKPEWRQV